MQGKSHRWIISFIAGALVAVIPLGFYSLTKGHHYSEHGTFFRGALDGQQVVGVAFVEYDGWGFMELTQWKVELVNRLGQRVTLYRKSSVFQEKIPHQPQVEISGGQIHIDDGEDKMTITFQHASKDGV
ncbi:MAG: hypothetical protein K9N47_23725 [Prosthecobacter sp.]|uniref:hypothetical protein n=1 Tax=Prosthecobacter sp. TaxID=1965333 RepID=UPI0026244C31|nr:hypothetical protein [Prosthecobacter sp.]MCF7789155.1 hypothetical protein [Prosthecobacter sp.]